MTLTTILKPLDKTMNILTMYRGVLYSLTFVVLVAIVLSFTTDLTGVKGLPLLTTVLALALGCYLSNQLFSRLYKAPANTESWLITALILACIISPSLAPGRLVFALLCGAVAMASKYVITWRGSHIFNPAAFGATVFSLAGVLPVTWWIANPALLPVVALILALPILYKVRKFQVFGVFALVSVLIMLCVQSGMNGAAIPEVLRSAVLSWPLVFLGGVMLTEPMTMPARRHTQLLMAVIVGVVFASQLDLGFVSATPHMALLVGNLFAAAMAPPFAATLKVRSNKQLAGDITELTFDKPAGISYLAGQYMDFTLAHNNTDSRGNRRSFSLVSAPHEDVVRIAMRTFREGSSYKKALVRLKPGDTLRAANPRGDFVLPADSATRLLLIAGGIGITPIRSMLSALVNSGQKRDIVLVYTGKDLDHFAYKKDIERAKVAGVTTYFETKRLSQRRLQELVPDVSRRKVYISGSVALIRTYDEQLRALGVSPRAMHTDQFNGY